jgi:hypothetical protein
MLMIGAIRLACLLFAIINPTSSPSTNVLFQSGLPSPRILNWACEANVLETAKSIAAMRSAAAFAAVATF